MGRQESFSKGPVKQRGQGAYFFKVAAPDSKPHENVQHKSLRFEYFDRPFAKKARSLS